MRHTDKEIEQAAVEFERWIDNIDVDAADAKAVYADNPPSA